MERDALRATVQLLEADWVNSHMGKNWAPSGKTPRHRSGLTRKRKPMRLDLRMDARSKLERLALALGEHGRALSLTATIEKLIFEAGEPERLPIRPSEYVRAVTETRQNME